MTAREQAGQTAVAQRAEPPRIPPASAELAHAEAEHKAYVAGRERLEQRSVVRGLVVLALVVLLASMLRAGFERVFVHSWWRP